MWQYNNVCFIYSNEVDSVFGQRHCAPPIFTYVKSKYALMEALRIYVNNSTLGVYAQIDPKTVKHDQPFKV